MMRDLVFANSFLQSAKNIDISLQQKLKETLDILQRNPFYPTLHTKALVGRMSGFYSCRLGGDYRIIFTLLSDEYLYLIKIGHRKDVYQY